MFTAPKRVLVKLERGVDTNKVRVDRIMVILLARACREPVLMMRIIGQVPSVKCLSSQ